MKKVNKTKLLFGILFLSMCFQNIEILNLGSFGLKLFHVVGVLYFPWLLTKMRHLKLPSKLLTVFLIFMLEMSFLHMAKYGIHSLNFNYVFSFYILLLICNCGSTLTKDDWLDIVKKVALIALIAVYINAIIHIKIILNFLKHPWGHPVYTFIFGGGANLEATWIGLFGVFFKDDKKGFIYTALCSVISAMLASRVGIIVDAMCFVVLTFSTTKEKPRYVKKIRLISMMVLGITMIIFFLGTGIIDYLLKRLEAVGTDVGSKARIFMWENAFKAFLNNPFGYGIGNSIVAINLVSDTIITESNIHNLYLQMLLDTGIIGGVCYIGIILSFIMKEIKNFFNDSVVSFIVLYFLLGFIQFRGGETIMFFIVGIYLASRKQKAKGVEISENK